jgi:hypothetical protein
MELLSESESDEFCLASSFFFNFLFLALSYFISWSVFDPFDLGLISAFFSF